MFDNEEDYEELFDDEDDEGLSEMEEWYDDNYEYFNRESRQKMSIYVEVPPDVELFYHGIYCPALADIAPEVRKLIERQYPSTKGETRPKLVEYINWIASMAGKQLLLACFELVEDINEGVNLRKKYPSFDNWVENYGSPQAPPKPDYSFADSNPEFRKQISDEIIKQVAEDSCAEETEHFLLTESLRKEYFDIVQPIIFKYFKVLTDLTYEGWIVYASEIHADYYEYTERCDYIDTVISYNFDEDDLYLSHKEFMEKLQMKMDEEWNRKQ